MEDVNYTLGISWHSQPVGDSFFATVHMHFCRLVLEQVLIRTFGDNFSA